MLSSRQPYGLTKTYDKGLVESEHDDQLDGQEFREGPPASQFFLRKAVEDKQTIERNPTVGHERRARGKTRRSLTLY